MDRPETRYAHAGDASIAHQVFGNGPAEVLLALGPASHERGSRKLKGVPDELRLYAATPAA